MITIEDPNIELAARRARLDAARADPSRTTIAAIAAMAAGAGAELVARRQRALEILECRIERSAAKERVNG